MTDTPTPLHEMTEKQQRAAAVAALPSPVATGVTDFNTATPSLSQSPVPQSPVSVTPTVQPQPHDPGGGRRLVSPIG